MREGENTLTLQLNTFISQPEQTSTSWKLRLHYSIPKRNTHHQTNPQSHQPSNPTHPRSKTEIATAHLPHHDITRASPPPPIGPPLSASPSTTQPRCRPLSAADTTIQDPANGVPRALFQVVGRLRRPGVAGGVQGNCQCATSGIGSGQIRLGGYRVVVVVVRMGEGGGGI